MSTHWMAGQLSRMADGRNAMPLEIPRYNPRPPGVIREGSASHAIVAFLHSNPGRFFCEGDFIRQTGRSRASITWALHYLTGIGVLSAINDGRHARHQKYRMARK